MKIDPTPRSRRPSSNRDDGHPQGERKSIFPARLPIEPRGLVLVIWLDDPTLPLRPPGGPTREPSGP